MVRWSLESLREGVFPRVDSLGRPWGEANAGRSVSAGGSLGFKGMVLFIKSDLAEVASTFWATFECKQDASLLFVPCNES